ncbi:MAG: flagellar M-ring protein FliF C-terminal domain-containing protein [Wujia sp.]
MREWFRQLPAKIVEFWKKYTRRQKTLFFSVLAAVLIAVIGLVLILNRTSYVTLSTFEDTATSAQAANLLEENSITYRVSDDALKIEVDESQVSQARLLLGENGIGTNSGKSDYDSLFDNSFNTTDSEKKLKAKLYKQSEMERDIASIEGVTKASVTINLPDNTNTVYASDQTASVSIMLTINSNYKEESTNAIAEYAKSCVGNSDTDAITIVDNKGELLFSGRNATTSASATLLVEQQVEEYYNSKLWNLMVNSGVYDEVSVSANLDVNISQQEIQNIEYYSNDEDDTGPKSSYYYYLAENTDGTGGVVGTDANGEEITDYDLLDNANGESTLTLIKENYETSSTTTRTVTPVGDVNMENSSMAMYLTRYQNYYEEDLKEQGLLDDMSFAEFQAANSEVTENVNPEEMVNLLASATGMRAKNIYVVERIVPVFYPAEEKEVPVQSILSIVLAVIIGALLLFVVFKSMKPEEVVEVEPELSVEALLATTKENQTLDDIEFSDKSASKQQIEKFVDENPEAVVSLLRNWLNEDWE